MPGRDAAALRPHVAGLQAYDLCLDEPAVHRGLPSTGVTLVLPVGRPLDVGWSGRPTSRDRRWSTVSGLHTRPAQIHQAGRERGVQLTLTMAGARALLGVPAAELAHGLHRVEEVCPALADLPERLADTRTCARPPIRSWRLCCASSTATGHGPNAPRCGTRSPRCPAA